jgi:hypothetical protein
MSDTQVIFLEDPQQGRPVRFLHNGCNGKTSVVVWVVRDEYNPSMLKVGTQSGRVYYGIVQRQDSTLYFPSPAIQSVPDASLQRSTSILDQPVTVMPSTTSMFASTAKQILGIVGAFALGAGVFAPLVKLPIVGAINYFGSGRADGVFILLLAIVSLVAVMLRRYVVLWGTAGISITILLFLLHVFNNKMREVSNEAQAEQDEFLQGLGKVMAETVQIQWGWGLMLAGAILLLMTAAIREPKEQQVINRRMYE